MTTDDEFPEELARKLPVEAMYKDALSPAAKQLGQFGEDLLKALQLALAPVQALAALQDRYRSFVDTSIRRVPPERRIAPPPQILGPVIEGIRYEPEGTPIDEMYSHLLSSSMDSERVDKAHPAYPFIVRQLSADEARVLEAIHMAEEPFEMIQLYAFKDGRSYAGAIEKDNFPRDNLTFPDNVTFYMGHLQQLGIAVLSDHRQDPIYDSATPGKIQQTGVRVFFRYQLTDMGLRFLEACHSPSFGVDVSPDPQPHYVLGS
jgi:hypothetical protein